MITVSATALGVWFGFRDAATERRLPEQRSAGSSPCSLIGAGDHHCRRLRLRVRRARREHRRALDGARVHRVRPRRLAAARRRRRWRSSGRKANDVIWTGGDPLPGQVKFTFWHTMFFAWFCNMAMHIGMADLIGASLRAPLLVRPRHRRRACISVTTSPGSPPRSSTSCSCGADPGNTAVLPGPLAYNACGIAGLICVVVAGWTTANPTIYRAGLAFQAIVPRLSRYRSRWSTGAITTDRRACSRPIAMQLLGFRRALRDAADADGRGQCSSISG